MDSKKVILLSDIQYLKKYEFKPVDKIYKILIERDLKDYLMKWYMDKSFRIFTYNFQDTYDTANKDQLFKDLFHSEVILKDLGYQSWINSKDEKTRIEIEDVPCTILSTEFFDRIYENEIVLHDGTIRKCFEEYMDDIVIADELRNMLLVEESENYPLYTEKERAEFLFLIFKHICLGGSLNQYEDNINPYILMAKTLYKDVICVRKTGSPKKTTIMSQVSKVEVLNNDIPIYPSHKHHEQNFSYVIHSPTLKEVTILHHTWKPTGGGTTQVRE
ncbi:Uncharacterized protein C11orf70 [Araneus ventricosus]|uniref:Cilia- and flagella-associated protein 300 n=1 Tax=Araneus ventricosus TaxID=182803 RepID=A0A4Y2G4W2_ARAVE|nr:Uncharacterized protein C11orf70 [Araneus ventricosus]